MARRKAYEGEKRISVNGKEYVGHYFYTNLTRIDLAFNPHGKEVQARFWEPKMPVTPTVETVMHGLENAPYSLRPRALLPENS